MAHFLHQALKCPSVQQRHISQTKMSMLYRFFRNSIHYNVPFTEIKHLIMYGGDCVVQLLQLKFHYLAQEMVNNFIRWPFDRFFYQTKTRTHLLHLVENIMRRRDIVYNLYYISAMPHILRSYDKNISINFIN